MEELTDRMEREAEEYLARIDGMGGAVRAIEAGYPQAEIQNAAYAAQLAVERGEQVIVGVNRFAQDAGAAMPVFRVNPAVEAAQVRRVREVRAGRNAGELRRRLAELEAAARGTENLMPLILGAATAYGTVGEISDVLRGVFGEYREV